MGEGDSTGEKRNRIMLSTVRREPPRNCLCNLASNGLCGPQTDLHGEPQEDSLWAFPDEETEARGIR